MKVFQWLAAFLWLASAPILAQEVGTPSATGNLTLEEAQKEALEKSPEYHRAQDMEREKGWAQLEVVSSGFLPQVSVSAQHIFDVNYQDIHIAFPGFGTFNFPGIYPSNVLNLDAKYDLFDGFKNIHRLDSANNAHAAAKVLSDWALLSVQEQVRLKFYQALAAKMLSDMADENVKTLEDHLRIVQDQLDNGQATKYDVLRVDVQLSEAKSDQISAHDNVVLAREGLAQTMGIKDDGRPLTGDLPVPDANAILEGPVTAGYEDSPQLKAKELESKSAADESAAAANFWFPRISLMGEYQWYNDPDYLAAGLSYNDTFRNAYFFGASATWDILDGGESVAKANEADQRAQQAREDYAAARLQTPYDFDLWKRKLVSSMALYKARLTDIEEAKESARLATVGFKAGTRTTTDVLDAELQEYQASAGLVQAQIDTLEALINLELVTGKRYSHE